ncbi:hemolymph lipopolysaccharide-binding protein-like [Megalopta genalis]|uniref:hemolymph lipopolysaccharide-binding protein-like n=1 Tax=Megalopta genalis TaxID=115081 RepID=UPI003FD0E474
MRKFSLTFLVIILVALFIAEFSNGQPTDFTKNNDIKNGGALPYRRYKDRIGCIHFLDRCDYIVTPGIGAHKVHRHEVTWNEAQKICMVEGAHLAVLDSAEKENKFDEWINKEYLGGLWLGFHGLFERGSWTTVTGQFVDKLEYNPWAESEPDITDEKYRCGMLRKKYGFNDGAESNGCDKRFPFVCEINLCSALNQTVSNEKLAKLS